MGVAQLREFPHGRFQVESHGAISFTFIKHGQPHFQWPTWVDDDGEVYTCMSGEKQRLDEIVANAFGLPGSGPPEHIDGDPLNCNLTNLRRGPVEDTDTPLNLKAKIVSETEKNLSAMPKAMQYAHQVGIDLTEVTGTGHEGRITLADVQAYQKERIRNAEADEGPSVQESDGSAVEG